jgi:hypothetical protein
MSRHPTTPWTVDRGCAGRGSLPEFLYSEEFGRPGGHHRTIFDECPVRSPEDNKYVLVGWPYGIVTYTTFRLSVSGCGTCRPLLLASSHCYDAHFNCEQELNSTCTRSFLDQHTRCNRDALLSNARLTFTPQRFLGIRPSPVSGAPPQSSLPGKTAFEPQ